MLLWNPCLAAEAGDAALLPTTNLSNKLNPNNIHYDREAASQYKTMSKADKEALWAHDRGRPQPPQPLQRGAGLYSPGLGSAERTLSHHSSLEPPLGSVAAVEGLLGGGSIPGGDSSHLHMSVWIPGRHPTATWPWCACRACPGHDVDAMVVIGCVWPCLSVLDRQGDCAQCLITRAWRSYVDHALARSSCCR